MDCRSCCIFSNSSCLGLYLASTEADTCLSSSESSIAFCTLTTATLSWADATVARGARTRHNRPARIARERNIVLGLLRMEKHRVAYPPGGRGASRGLNGECLAPRLSERRYVDKIKFHAD